jgi:hypothetical protein
VDVDLAHEIPTVVMPFFRSPVSSMTSTASGSPSRTSSVPSISPYRCRMRFFLASKSGSVTASRSKGHALLTEQEPQALVADVVDHLLGDQEPGQLGQAPAGIARIQGRRTHPG